ncbi:MAG TPA: hypothetical protein VMU05_13330 [Dongiaceae bacterium]|nr:hypothetical protein [Dongiaceae bacterium]
MKPSLICALLFSLPPALVCQNAEQQRMDAGAIISKMAARDIERDKLSGGYSGTRRYVLENDRLHRHAELVVGVYCASDGSKHFDVVSETGWKSATKLVLRKMLESESEVSNRALRPKTRLTPENYLFSTLGTEVVEGRPAYVIGVVPRRRDKYLMEGRIWVDVNEFALVRAEGQPAGNLSFWTHSVHFVQRYKKDGEFWFPLSTNSVTEAMVFGTTYVNIAYSNYVPNSNESASQQLSSREIAYANH